MYFLVSIISPLAYCFYHRQLVAVIKEIVGEVHEGDIESRLRVKRILTRAILMVAVVYGSVSCSCMFVFKLSLLL